MILHTVTVLVVSVQAISRYLLAQSFVRNRNVFEQDLAVFISRLSFRYFMSNCSPLLFAEILLEIPLSFSKLPNVLSLTVTDISLPDPETYYTGKKRT